MPERLRGRAAVEQRARRLANEPLCRDCIEKGIVTAATVPDHIVPLSKGGSDDDANIRCLCTECHLKRTAEQFGHRYKQPTGLDGYPIDALPTAAGGGGSSKNSSVGERKPHGDKKPHKTRLMF